MIEQQIHTWEVLDKNLLNLYASLRREDFMLPQYRHLAFADTPIPIGHGQFSMTPKLEARLLQHLELSVDARVLEVGTGSGWMTCLLSQCVDHVVSIDIYADFIAAAEKRLAVVGVENVYLEVADIFHWQTEECFDAVLVTGSIPVLTQDWLHHLRPGGRLICVVGQSPAMEVILMSMDEQANATRESLFETDLPPLVGMEVTPQFQF